MKSVNKYMCLTAEGLVRNISIPYPVPRPQFYIIADSLYFPIRRHIFNTLKKNNKL